MWFTTFHSQHNLRYWTEDKLRWREPTKKKMMKKACTHCFIGTVTSLNFDAYMKWICDFNFEWCIVVYVALSKKHPNKLNFRFQLETLVGRKKKCEQVKQKSGFIFVVAHWMEFCIEYEYRCVCVTHGREMNKNNNTINTSNGDTAIATATITEREKKHTKKE